MFYFVGNNIGQKITGIEKAIINRLNLLKNIIIQQELCY